MVDKDNDDEDDLLQKGYFSFRRIRLGNVYIFWIAYGFGKTGIGGFGDNDDDNQDENLFLNVYFVSTVTYKGQNQKKIDQV